MPTIQLTIKTDYLPSWGPYEGVRELIQNAKDAEVEHDAEMKIDWVKDTLRIENVGTTLPTKALLLGHTSKLGNSSMIGKFGEGLKLGVLALVRAGHPIKIRNGSEVWTPVISRSELFDEDVLAFQIEGGREAKERVRIEIGGVTKEAWEEMQDCFLFLKPPKGEEVITVDHGQLLLGPRFKGRVYVKGIFVQNSDELAFGYNLQEVDLDRDRKMVESWNLRFYTRKIVLAAVNYRGELFDQFAEILENPTLEVDQIEYAPQTDLPDNLSEKVRAHFAQKHGDDAVPVANLAESRTIEHLGRKPVIVTKPLGTILAKSFGNAEKIQKDLEKEITHTYTWAELTTTERAMLTGAIDQVAEVALLRMEDIAIVAFRNPSLQCQERGGVINLSVQLLRGADAAYESLLTVIIREVARRGESAGVPHLQGVEMIWGGIFRGLRLHLNHRFNRVG